MGLKNMSDLYNGGGLVRHCVAALDVKPSMLASLLGVTERTLDAWTEEPILEARQGKIDRLKALYEIVKTAENEGLRGKIILNVLNESIPGEEADKSLLHYVVDEPNNILLDAVVRKVVASFK